MTEQISTRPLQLTELNDAFAIHKYFAGDLSKEEYVELYRQSPGLHTGCYLGEELIGIAVGKASTETDVVMELIAVVDEHSGRGYGSQLLVCFENQVAQAGYRRISLGSAGGYVEHFYLKNGYRPKSFTIWVAEEKVDPVVVQDLGLTDEPNGNSRRVSVNVTHMDLELRARIEQAFDEEVCVIFEKYLDS